MTTGVIIMEGMESYTPAQYKKKDWLDNVFAFFQDPVEGDANCRTGAMIFADNMTGVTQHQLDQRAGRVEHEIVAHVEEARNFVTWVEEQCDKLVAKFK